MLVYHIDSMGYTSIEGRRIYGRFFNYGRFGPTEISYDVFRKNRALLEEEYITDEWLNKRFGANFPSVNLKLTEMWKIDFKLLIRIANLLGIKYTKPRHPTITEKNALRRAIFRTIDDSPRLKEV